MTSDRFHAGRLLSGPTVLTGLAILAFLGACEFGTAPGFVPTEPRIAYVTPACDTVERAAAHPVQSTGGVISAFTVTPALPDGIVLDSVTGLISGTPTTAQLPRDYSVIATGPQGVDTAVIRLWVVAPFVSGTPGGPAVPAPPAISYDSPVVDTVGLAASHSPWSLGGTVTSFAALSSLPAGLSLNASTGRISGKPTAVQDFADIRVVATGPGGKDTALLRLAVVQKPAKQSASLPPRIAYDSPAYDTVGIAASHPVASFGGKVTSYALLSYGTERPLPKGLTLNPTTGLISGTPEFPDNISVALTRKAAKGSAEKDPSYGGYATFGQACSIVAIGPGGRDTAEIFIEVAWFETGWLPGPGPGDGAGVLTLRVNLESTVTLLKKMIVTLTSNVNDTLRDTVQAGASGFSGFSPALVRSYRVKPLRWWTANVKTLDARDSILHEGAAGPVSIHVEQSVLLTMNGTLRYENWQVQFSLPDSLASSTGPNKQLWGAFRVRVTLDGVVVRDTMKASGFFAATPTIHVVGYDYVKPASHVWGVQIFGDYPGGSRELPLFNGSVTIGAQANSATAVMFWTGPGSTADPAPIITPRPTVEIRRNSVVVLDYGLVDPLPKR